MAVRWVCIGMAKIYKPNKGCTLKDRKKIVWANEHGEAAVGRKKKKKHCEKCEENAEHIRATEMDSVHSNEQTQWMTVRSIF